MAFQGCLFAVSKAAENGYSGLGRVGGRREIVGNALIEWIDALNTISSFSGYVALLSCEKCFG